MSELMKLIEQEIPEGRQNLQDNFSNLEKVAQYCQENYLQATDKKDALEKTKNFTTHSLASVAYQINNLATNFLKLLDLQQNQLAEMESNVNHLAQTVNIHKEKVARREIGLLTTNRSTTRPLGVKNGIIFPEHGERPTKYLRKTIDYSQLDEIGHGVKSHGPPGRSPSISSSSGPSTPAPANQPPTPPSSNQGSIGRAQGQYIMGDYRRPAPVVAPPNVPNAGQYASMQQEQQRMSSAYAPGTPPTMGISHSPMGMGMAGHLPGGGGHQPPIGISRPMSQQSQGGGGMPPPPAAPGMMPGGPPGARMSQQMPRQSSGEDLPPPPPADGEEAPPERESQRMSFDEGPPPPPPPQFLGNEEDPANIEEDPYAATGPDMFSAMYTPETYLEKVIAIYDYQADKEDELTFSENSVIYVLKKNDDGWYEGVLNGQTGLFPGNYVEGCI